MKNKYYILILILFFQVFSIAAQIGRIGKVNRPDGGTMTNGRELNDTIGSKFNKERTVELAAKTHYTDYKIISYKGDSTVVDTTLSYKKYLIFNHLRKHNFELLSLHNLGQTYNRLGYDFNKLKLLPQTGIREKHYDFIDKEAVNYYHVPTPTSVLFYKTGLNQGQILNSMLTTNITPELNISIGYKGLRSIGYYRNALASRQNLRLTTSFKSKNKAYQLKAHYVSHNNLNEENGGLTPISIENYTLNNPDYIDRARMETNFSDAKSLLKTKRYYLQNSYNIWQNRDTVSLKKSYFKVGHEFVYSKKKYYYNQLNDVVAAFQTEIADSTVHKTLENTVYAAVKSPYILGKLDAKISHTSYNYGYNAILFIDSQTIPQHLKGNTVTASADWKTDLKHMGLETAAGVVLQGYFKGNYLTGTASYTKDSLFTAKATIMAQSASPDFNFLLYQSTYMDYNWFSDLENEYTRYLGFSLASEKLLDAEVSITQKDFYTYFDENSKPAQASGINYLKVKAHKAFSYKKFTLDNTVQYQKVATGGEYLRVPEFLSESGLYYTDYLFEGNPLLLQTGVSVKYFSKYKANEFNPILNEFILQNTMEIGNYPIINVFVNGQIRRTRLYLKAENVSSIWQHNHFVTPTHVYRDLVVRFGVVWNFFL